MLCSPSHQKITLDTSKSVHWHQGVDRTSGGVLLCLSPWLTNRCTANTRLIFHYISLIFTVIYHRPFIWFTSPFMSTRQTHRLAHTHIIHTYTHEPHNNSSILYAPRSSHFLSELSFHQILYVVLLSQDPHRHSCMQRNHTTYKYTHNYTTTRVLYLSHLFIVDRNYHSITSSMSHRMYPYIRNKFRSLYKSNTHIFDIEHSPPLTVATIATVATTTTTT